MPETPGGDEERPQRVPGEGSACELVEDRLHELFLEDPSTDEPSERREDLGVEMSRDHDTAAPQRGFGPPSGRRP